jgi:hypothetical protein
MLGRPLSQIQMLSIFGLLPIVAYRGLIDTRRICGKMPPKIPESSLQQATNLENAASVEVRILFLSMLIILSLDPLISDSDTTRAI